VLLRRFDVIADVVDDVETVAARLAGGGDFKDYA
jgi:hypothetical protein